MEIMLRYAPLTQPAFQQWWHRGCAFGLLALGWLFLSEAAEAQVIKSAVSPSKPKLALVSQAITIEATQSSLGKDGGVSADAVSPSDNVLRGNALTPVDAVSSEVAIRPLVDGRSVATQAAACWPPARLLQQRADTLEGGSPAHGDAARQAVMVARFLRCQSQRQRDVAAAMALRAYYAWLGNRMQQELLRSGEKLLDQQAALESALSDHGIAVEDPTSIERKRLELQDQTLVSQHTDNQLAQSLLQLTSCASDVRLAEVETLEIRPSEVNCDALVAYALTHRADYQAWLRLCECLDRGTVGAVVHLLAPLAGGVDIDLVGAGWLAHWVQLVHAGETVDAVGRELRTAIAWQRRLIQQTVCDKCAALTLAYQRVGIAEQVVESWVPRIAALERAEQLGNAKGELLLAARGERLKAQAALVSRQLEAKLAEVDLADAVGGLAVRCAGGLPWLVNLTDAASYPQ